MPHVFLHGDTHADFWYVENFCKKWNTSKDDLMIVLGDNGVNYYGDSRDTRLKHRLSSLPISFFFIKGNHDMRPSLGMDAYHATSDAHPLFRGDCLVEDKFPSLLFAPMYGKAEFFSDGEWLTTFVLGGAYSADKYYRLEMQKLGHPGYRWFDNEQMTPWEMKEAFSMIQDVSPPIILSHTCPFKYIPRDMFLPDVDQYTVDDTMEHFFDRIEESVPYKKWYCGHWHTDRSVDKMRFMFHDIVELNTERMMG